MGTLEYTMPGSASWEADWPDYERPMISSRSRTLYGIQTILDKSPSGARAIYGLESNFGKIIPDYSQGDNDDFIVILSHHSRAKEEIITPSTNGLDTSNPIADLVFHAAPSAGFALSMLSFLTLIAGISQGFYFVIIPAFIGTIGFAVAGAITLHIKSLMRRRFQTKAF